MIKSQKVSHRRLKCARSRHTQHYQSHIVVICVHPLLPESPERHLRFQVFWPRRAARHRIRRFVKPSGCSHGETIPSMELYSGHKYLSLASGASCRVISNRCFWREEKKTKQQHRQKERKKGEKPAGTTHRYSRGALETADRFSPPQTFPALHTRNVSLESRCFLLWAFYFFLPFPSNIFVILSSC